MEAIVFYSVRISKFKAKSSEIKSYPLCLVNT